MLGISDHNQKSLPPRNGLKSNAYMTMVIYTENRYVLNFKFHVRNARP